MNLAQLRDFVAVIRNGGFRSASRFLGVSPAALTKSISKFEDECGFPLIQRHAKGIMLTELGVQVYKSAELLLENSRQMEEWIKSKGRSKITTVSLGASIEPLLRFLHAVVADFRRTFPEVTLVLKQSIPAELIESVRQGGIEFAIARVPASFSYPDLFVERICTAESSIIGRAGHPAANTQNISELANYGWIVLGDRLDPGVQDDSIRNIFTDNGLTPPSILAVTDSFVGAITLLTTSDCLIRLPKALLRHPVYSSFLTEIKVTHSFSTGDIAIIRAASAILSNEAQMLIGMVKSFARVSRFTSIQF